MTNEVTEIFIRREHVMVSPNGAVQDCGSINAAKRYSRDLQKAGKTVRVEHPHVKHKIVACGRGPLAGVVTRTKWTPPWKRRKIDKVDGTKVKIKTKWKLRATED